MTSVNTSLTGHHLASSEMQTQCLTSLWLVYRKDNENKATPADPELYTSFDQDITLNRLFFAEGGPWEFTAARAVRRSASQKEIGMRPSNMSFQGVVDGLSLTDIREGRYDGARILEHVVDWRWPWRDALQINTYYVTVVSFTGEGYELQIEGMGRLFRETSGHQFNRPCRWTLGEGGCSTNRTSTSGPAGISISTYTYGSTSALGVGTVDTTSPRRKFSVTLASGTPNMPLGGKFRYGHVIWRSGDNVNLKSEIRLYQDDLSAPAGGESYWIVLQDELPNAIDASDTCVIAAGCEGTYEMCDGTYSNAENFGGEFYIPGPTRSRQPQKVTWD